jgi:pimeloyl-ACP methyl ester carboxylesterase
VHQAFTGDFTAFANFARQFNPGRSIARGMYLSVTCSEGIPFITDREATEQSSETFVGIDRIRVHQHACASWPRATVPAHFTDYVTARTPVLMLSGAVDGSTPPWFGADAVRDLSNGRQIVVRNMGHQLDGPCIQGIFNRFLETASVAGIDTTCTASIRRPPFLTQVPRPRQLRVPKSR